MIILRERDYVAVPWKNGGGITREIHRAPVDSVTFDWRLSLATIDRPGPFSAFEGYERTLVLVHGAGVHLDFGHHGSARLSTPGEAVSFDGAWDTNCTLLDGPSTDLNVMVSKERAAAHVRVAQVTTEIVQTSEWTETLVCCVSGSVQIASAAGTVEMLSAVDVARCFRTDGVVTCTRRGSNPAVLLIAAVAQRPQ